MMSSYFTYAVPIRLDLIIIIIVIFIVARIMEMIICSLMHWSTHSFVHGFKTFCAHRIDGIDINDYKSTATILKMDELSLALLTKMSVL